LNSEKIWKIWKKAKLNSDIISIHSSCSFLCCLIGNSGRDRKHPWSTTQHNEHIRKHQKNGFAIIEGAPHENKMAGKGQITSERASS
jgi:hypothetical protein